MKHSLLALLFVVTTNLWGQSLNLSSTILDGSKESFISHQGPGQFDTYLTLELPFSPAAEFFKQLLLLKRFQLANRGEAHITVISPVEFWKKLETRLTMQEIDKLALDENLQSMKFDVKCLGMGEALVGNKREKAFYLVIESFELMNFRTKIRDLFVSKGGDPALFNPKDWYPHITIGFTLRDLHESDKVYKNEASCHLPINLI